jgi:hypothetical protein
MSRVTGRLAPIGALDRLRLFAYGLFATALLVGAAALATGQAGTSQAPRAAGAAVGASAHLGASLHDSVLQPVTAVVSHGTNSPRPSPNTDVGLVTVAAVVASGVFVATRRPDRPGDVAPERLPQRRAPPRSLSLR